MNFINHQQDNQGLRDLYNFTKLTKRRAVGIDKLKDLR